MPLLLFDDVRVDTAGFRVERGGRAVALEPKAFDLLVLLLERQGQVVTKQEILDAVWRQTAVTDNALTRIVAHLRKALGDDARDAATSRRCRRAAIAGSCPSSAGRRARASRTPSAVRARRARWPRRGLAVTALAVLAAVAALSLAYRQGLTRESGDAGRLSDVADPGHGLPAPRRVPGALARTAARSPTPPTAAGGSRSR